MTEFRLLITVDDGPTRDVGHDVAKLAFRERGPCFVLRAPILHALAPELAVGSRVAIERVGAGGGARLKWWEGSLEGVVIHADHVEATSYPDSDPRWLDEEGCVA